MAGLILLSLPLSIMLVALVVLMAIIDVARRPPKIVQRASAYDASAAWPINELLETTARLTGEIAIGQGGCRCPDTPFIPRVTDPEARAIALEVRQLGPAEVNRALEQSRAHHQTCPMRREDGLCACSVVRPLDCLGRCFAGADSPEWAQGLGQTVSTAFHRHLESHHSNSATRRLDDALLAMLDEPQTDDSLIGKKSANR